MDVSYFPTVPTPDRANLQDRTQAPCDGHTRAPLVLGPPVISPGPELPGRCLWLPLSAGASSLNTQPSRAEPRPLRSKPTSPPSGPHKLAPAPKLTSAGQKESPLLQTQGTEIQSENELLDSCARSLFECQQPPTLLSTPGAWLAFPSLFLRVYGGGAKTCLSQRL